MTRWEYKQLQCPQQHRQLDWLNEMGSQGWELVACAGGVPAAYIFKRPKREASAGGWP